MNDPARRRSQSSTLTILVILLALLAAGGWALIATGEASRYALASNWVSILGLVVTLVVGVLALVTLRVRRIETGASGRGTVGGSGSVAAADRGGPSPGEGRVPERFVDDLTGLPALFWFEQTLTTEIARGRRYRHPLSLIVLDIDNFTRLNQLHGHATGDYVLMTVAGILRSTVRQTDLISRIRDDEFAVLVPETDRQGADHVAEKLRRAVELYPFDEGLEVTVSIALAEAGAPENAQLLLGRAEDTVVAARDSGGNTVARSELQT